PYTNDRDILTPMIVTSLQSTTSTADSSSGFFSRLKTLIPSKSIHRLSSYRCFRISHCCHIYLNSKMTTRLPFDTC
ncbi:MAG: hypothetical protein M5F18_09215, partial [Asgard group archaeon]|nr:hypothetical protein [Asgard group archaeon]